MLEKLLVAPNTKKVKRVLRKGMQGQDVVYMQTMLDKLNTYYRFCPQNGVKATGYFGDHTENLLKFFQYWVGLDYWACYFEKNTSKALDAKFDEYLDDTSEDALRFARTRKLLDDMADGTVKRDPFDIYN